MPPLRGWCWLDRNVHLLLKQLGLRSGGQPMAAVPRKKLRLHKKQGFKFLLQSHFYLWQVLQLVMSLTLVCPSPVLIRPTRTWYFSIRYAPSASWSVKARPSTVTGLSPEGGW